MKLGILTAPFPRDAARRGRRLGELGRLRGAGNRLLAEILRPDPPLCRHRHIDVAATSASRGARRSSPRWRSKNLSVSGARLLSQPAASRSRPPRDRHRSSEEGDRRGRRMGVPAGQHLLRRRRREACRRQLAGGAEGLARHRRPCARQRRQARLRELPDDLQPRRVAGRAQHRLFALRSGAASSRPGAATSA